MGGKFFTIMISGLAAAASLLLVGWNHRAWGWVGIVFPLSVIAIFGALDSRALSVGYSVAAVGLVAVGNRAVFLNPPTPPCWESTGRSISMLFSLLLGLFLAHPSPSSILGYATAAVVLQGAHLSAAGLRYLPTLLFASVAGMQQLFPPMVATAAAIAMVFSGTCLLHRVGKSVMSLHVVAFSVGMGVVLQVAVEHFGGRPVLSALLYSLFLVLAGVFFGVSRGSGRVLWVTKPLDPPFNDGSKVLPRTILEHLADERITICVSQPMTPDSVWPIGVERARPYSRSGSFGGRFAQNLRVFIFVFTRRFQYRAIHFFFAPNRSASLAIKLIKAVSPGVLFVQTIMSRPRDFSSIGPLLFGDVIVSQSEDSQHKVQSYGGQNSILVRPSVNVCDVSSVARSKRTSGPKTILFAGDIDHGGALAHLREVVPRILDKHPSLLFVFSVRTKTERTVAIAQEFFDSTLARYAPRAVMHVDYEDFGVLLDEQDAMLFPAEDLYSKVDAPLVVLETLARGIPVFMLDRPPLDEIPGADLRARLIGKDDDELVCRLESFLLHPETIPDTVLRSMVTERFSPRYSADRLSEIYEGTR